MSLTYQSYIEEPYSAPVLKTKPIIITLIGPEANPHELFYLLVLIIKSENNLNQKTNIFVCAQFHMHCQIDKFCIKYRKLIMTIELQYCVTLTANFNLNEFENLSVRFDRQSIISIQLFFNVMG